MKLAPNRDVRAIAGLALAQAGDTQGAEKVAAELDKSFPLDTVVQRYWLPTIRGAVAIEQKHSDRAIELLKDTTAIELATPTNTSVILCPVYVRGEVYLALHNGKLAAAEFQKFIDHPGSGGKFSVGSHGPLGLSALLRLAVRRAEGSLPI